MGWKDDEKKERRTMSWYGGSHDTTQCVIASCRVTTPGMRGNSEALRSRLACDSSMPLGLPVEPDEYCTNAIVSRPSGSRSAARTAAPDASRFGTRSTST